MPFADERGKLEILPGTTHARQERYVGIEPILEILKKLRLVTLHRPQIIAACLANLDGDLPLGVQRLANDHFVTQIYPTQQGRSLSDFILLAFDCDLGQRQAFTRQKQGE